MFLKRFHGLRRFPTMARRQGYIASGSMMVHRHVTWPARVPRVSRDHALYWQRRAGKLPFNVLYARSSLSTYSGSKKSGENGQNTDHTEEKEKGQDAHSESETDARISRWLLGCSAMVFGMVVLGGVTRLTESGLSIVEWKPVTGMIPPLSQEDWEQAFEDYKAFPEYQNMRSKDMTLEEFKKIFFWEWAHRFWGRMIGLAVAVPTGVLAMRGKLKGRPMLTRNLLGILGLIGAQGGLGWYMVKSGLDKEFVTNKKDEVVRVSHFRLAAHLGLAFAVYAALVWTAMRLRSPRGVNLNNVKWKVNASEKRKSAKSAWLRPAAIGALGMTSVTAFSGALVAGLDAGYMYNMFPFMGEGLVPPEYMELEGGWLENAAYNPASVQFHHRVMAISTLSWIVGFTLLARKRSAVVPPRMLKAIKGMHHMAWLQVALGISTLVMIVPVSLGAAHQAGALALFTTALRVVYFMPK